MSSQFILHLQTGSDASNQTMAPLLQTWLDGDLFIVGDRRRAADPGLAHSIKPSRIEDGLSLVMASPRLALIDVSYDYCGEFLGFVQDHPGTAGQIKFCIITAGADAVPTSVELVQAVLQTGVSLDQIRVVVAGVDMSSDSPREPQTLRSLHEKAADCSIVTVPTRVARALEKAQRAGLSLSSIFNHEIDYQQQFDNACISGENQDRLQLLAKQLLGQRFLLGATAEIERFVASLSLSSNKIGIEPEVFGLTTTDEAASQSTRSAEHPDSAAQVV